MMPSPRRFIINSLILSLAFYGTFVVATTNPKRGLAFADSQDTQDISVVTQPDANISWVYDWGTTEPSYLATTGFPYYPMQWGASGVESFESEVVSQKSAFALGFNEPDFATQSNINATYAASLWRTYIDPLHDSGVTLVAPAVTNADTGLPWLSEFLDACSGCYIDAIALHWYGDGLGSFYDYIWSAHGQFPDYNIWITEFASTNSDTAVVLDFLSQSISYLDSLDWVEKYSWFGFFRDDGTSAYNLLDSLGNLNDRGHVYFGI